MQALRKSPIKFTFNNVQYKVPVNNFVPAKGYVNVLAISPSIIDENTDNPAIRIFVQCNKNSQQNGRQYALFYNINKRQFDGHFTVN